MDNNNEPSKYLHGYSKREQLRLLEQAETLAPFIYSRLDFSGARRLLEVGCGVGGQTQWLLRRYPGLQITGLEKVPDQLVRAERLRASIPELSDRWDLQRADALDLGDFDGSGYDTALFVWVLEHLPDPLRAIRELVRMLPSGAKVVATEVFQSSLFLYPDCPSMNIFWQKTIDFQRSLGGDADVGPRLGALFAQAGLVSVDTWMCPMHFDAARDPEGSKAILAYWRDLTHSALPAMEAARVSDETEWRSADREMEFLQSSPDAVFSYTSFQAVGTVP
jgi:SAM-dependent methyltransferase